MATLRNVIKFSQRVLNKLTLKADTSQISFKNFSVYTACRSAYDADGKTIAKVMNNDADAPLMINSYSVLGFRLNNGCFIIGPVVIFPHSVLSWNIKDDHDIHEKSLSLFLRLHPKLDMLVIGLSDAMNPRLLTETKAKVMNLVKELKPGEKMNVEVQPTEKAVATFNFLNSEKRFVAAALLPPTNYSPTLDDEFRLEYLNKKRREKDDLLLG